jgi:hypothetical protein
MGERGEPTRPDAQAGGANFGESFEFVFAFRLGAERRIVSRRWQATNVYS